MSIEECIECNELFEARGDWQIRCWECYKKYKDRMNNKSATPKDPTAEWTKENIKALLILCHPDKHDNSNLSNSITRELITIMKNKT